MSTCNHAPADLFHELKLSVKIWLLLVRIIWIAAWTSTVAPVAWKTEITCWRLELKNEIVFKSDRVQRNLRFPVFFLREVQSPNGLREPRHSCEFISFTSDVLNSNGFERIKCNSIDQRHDFTRLCSISWSNDHFRSFSSTKHNWQHLMAILMWNVHSQKRVKCAAIRGAWEKERAAIHLASLNFHLVSIVVQVGQDGSKRVVQLVPQSSVSSSYISVEDQIFSRFPPGFVCGSGSLLFFTCTLPVLWLFNSVKSAPLAQPAPILNEWRWLVICICFLIRPTVTWR